MMFHTVFSETLDEAMKKYEDMKIDLQKYIDSDMENENFCGKFVERWN